MNKQAKVWVESMLVAYVDNQLDPAQTAAVEDVIRNDPEAQAIVGVLRHSAAAVKSAYDRPLHEPVPQRLLAAVGAASPVNANVVPLRRPLRHSRQFLMALAASFAALAIGFGAGYVEFAPAGKITAAGGGTGDIAGTGQFEAALYRVLEQDSPGTGLSYSDPAVGVAGSVVIVGPVATGFSDGCREFRHESSGPQGSTVAHGLACRSADGDWSILTLPPDPAA